MLTSLKRIFKIGYKNFFRALGLNLANVFVITVVVCLITTLFIFNNVADILIDQVRQKVDISVYFAEDAATEDIMSIKSELSKMPQVKQVEYVAKEDAMDTFVSRHKDDPIIMESLNEIGYNPFLASLSIMASDNSKYEEITKFLQADSYKNIINNVDYYKRKPVIDKIFSITSDINKSGLALSVLFGIIAVLVAFNTIRVAIHNSCEELSVMRLVGASNHFIQGPFLVQGTLAGLFSVVIGILVIAVFCFALNVPIGKIAPDVNIFSLFLNNFWILLLIQLVAGIGLGAVSSGIAVRKYLKI
jgi:cell division transport system permease protein